MKRRPCISNRTNRARLDRIAAAIRQRPGSTQAEIARAVNCWPSTVYVALPLLEHLGVLLVEDDAGRLSIMEN